MHIDNYREAKESTTQKISRRKGLFYVQVSLLSIVLSLLIYYANTWNSEQTIKEISVNGACILNQEDINTLISNRVLNKQKHEIDLKKIQGIVNKHPYVSSSAILFGSPGELVIKITERQPLAGVVMENGSLCFADKHAGIYPCFRSKQLPDIPLIRKVFDKNGINRYALRNAIKILNKLNQEPYKQIFSSISEIVYDKNSKTYCLLSTDNKLKILIGTVNEIKDKIKKLEYYWSNIRNSKSAASNRILDLRWQDRIVVS